MNSRFATDRIIVGFDKDAVLSLSKRIDSDVGVLPISSKETPLEAVKRVQQLPGKIDLRFENDDHLPIKHLLLNLKWCLSYLKIAFASVDVLICMFLCVSQLDIELQTAYE